MKIKILDNAILRDECGSVAIITALFVLFSLLATAGIAIDIGRQATAKNELQNTLDAAALAGAIELGQNGPANVKSEAKEAAENNSIDNNGLILGDNDIKVGNWTEPNFFSKTPYNSVKIMVNNHSINSFFASALNFQQTVSAEATAVIGPLSGKRHLIPIAVTEDEADTMSEAGEGIIYQFGRSAGNWGTVDFDAYIDGDQGGGNPEIGEWLENGYNGTIRIGDDINTESGVGKIVGGNNGQKVENLIGQKIFIPVVNEFGQGSTPGVPSTVMGFVAIEITALTGNGANTQISAKYLGTEVSSGPVDLDLNDSYGPIGVVLVQ
ncbi:TadE/TadG family type IV pilus assembly protein [Desulfohalobium retbaense]|uniref:Flp pilus-assembly TadG-like N-terminal domain-containing protein n=1 Tax=Desulfohalobium retbaense (strain ATCC 49708 / DSM 5692 / JCM 16813 / HR100) TaxID=485915 RepID=C8X1M9_DESRD|nr:TadE/TadG family type IV pilus assembly protein [Desulfohalobium retbaense]ACV68451.1 Protein of unknown function DUF2134, membrane [Desulfohalobium retbaense DSM 5692]